MSQSKKIFTRDKPEEVRKSFSGIVAEEKTPCSVVSEYPVYEPGLPLFRIIFLYPSQSRIFLTAAPSPLRAD